MMPGPTLDAFIAEQVFSYELLADGRWKMGESGGGLGVVTGDLPPFSTNVQAAEIVISEMKERGFGVSELINHLEQICFTFHSNHGDFSSDGFRDRAFAICVAARKAIKGANHESSSSVL